MMRSEKAFALPLVLWAVGILSAALVATVVFMDISLRSETMSVQAAAARQLALSGIAFASGSAAQALPLTVTRNIEGEGKFTVTRSSDSGRININALLWKKDLVSLKLILLAWGVDPPNADAAVAALAKRTWLQINDNAPSDFIPFESFAQLSAVPEFSAALRKKPNWQDSLTLWGTTGLIDLNYANADVLTILSGLTPAQVNAFVKIRAGADGIFGTKDDVKFQSIDQVVDQLELQKGAAAQLQRYFGTGSEMQRIEAKATTGRITRRIQVIVQAEGSNWIPVVWNEE